MSELPITACTEQDFLQIVSDLKAFEWNSPGLGLHNPMLLSEFPECALVVKDGATVVAYLFGLIGQRGRSGYIQLIATRAGYKKQGHATRLHNQFVKHAKSIGCTIIKAVTAPTNRNSMAFHTKMGMTPKLMNDYGGPGEDRLLFTKPV